MTAATPETLYQQARALLAKSPNSMQGLALLRQAAEQGHADGV